MGKQRQLFEKVEGFCDQCNKPFTTKKITNLPKRRTHEDIVICELCSSMFERKGSFERRIKLTKEEIKQRLKQSQHNINLITKSRNEYQKQMETEELISFIKQKYKI